MEFIRPQKCRDANDADLKRLLNDKDVIAEIKYNGHRRLFSSNIGYTSSGKRCYDSDIQRHIPHGCLLDGEMVPLNDSGDINHTKDHSDVTHMIASDPHGLAFVVFDILMYNWVSRIGMSYSDRLDMFSSEFPISVRRFRRSRRFGSKDNALWAAEQAGMEGVIFKNVNDTYIPGSRKNWYRYKFKSTHDVVIIDAEGNSKTDGFSGLRYGFYDGSGALRLVGGLGVTGPRDEMISHIGRVAEVEAVSQLKNGKLQHAGFKHWRDDKSPEECVFDFTLDK